MVFTPKEKKIANESWDIVRNDYYAAGIVFFREFFRIDSSYTRWFEKFKEFPEQDILDTKGMRSHLLDEAMPAIGMVLRFLDRPERLIPYLDIVGNTHRSSNISRKAWDDQRKALIYALREIVGSQFTSEVQAVWEKIIRYTFEAIADVAEKK